MVIIYFFQFTNNNNNNNNNSPVAAGQLHRSPGLGKHLAGDQVRCTLTCCRTTMQVRRDMVSRFAPSAWVCRPQARGSPPPSRWSAPYARVCNPCARVCRPVDPFPWVSSKSCGLILIFFNLLKKIMFLFGGNNNFLKNIY